MLVEDHVSAVLKNGGCMKSLDHSHTKEAIKQRLGQQIERSYIRDFIYGSIDGTVTTFAVVSGAAGAGLSEKIVFVLGCANLIADGFSMAVGNYEGVKAEKQLVDKYREMENEHIDRVPEGEREELRQIYRAKGFKGEDLENIVESISSHKEAWIEVMLKEEHGLSTATGNPLKAAGITYLAFCWLGLFPLLPYIMQALGFVEIPKEDLFVVSSILTAITFFAIGAVKGRLVQVSQIKSGLSTLLTGGAAALISYYAGKFLASLM